MANKIGDEVVIVDTKNHHFELYEKVTIKKIEQKFYICSNSIIEQYVLENQIKTLFQCILDNLKNQKASVSLTSILQNIKNEHLKQIYIKRKNQIKR